MKVIDQGMRPLTGLAAPYDLPEPVVLRNGSSPRTQHLRMAALLLVAPSVGFDNFGATGSGRQPPYASRNGSPSDTLSGQTM